MSRLLTAGLLAALVVLLPAPASAEQCAHKAYRVSGGPGLIETAAKRRARSAWIARVKASRKLGPPYAAWLRAKDAHYNCHKAGKGYVCEASAIPCRV